MFYNLIKRIVFRLYWRIKICHNGRVHISYSSWIGKKIRIIWRSNDGIMKLNENSKICDNAKIIMAGGDFCVGEGTCLGEGAIVNVFADVYIGDNVVTADNVNYITNTHFYEDITKPINWLGGTQNPIYIGDDSWIGINVTILDGTIIGKHCVVAANAVVKGIFPDYCVIAGIPAKIIKQYNFDAERWERKY